MRIRITDARAVWAWLIVLSLAAGLAMQAGAQGRRGRGNAGPPTLGLANGYLTLETPDFTLKLVKDSQTVAAMEPKGTQPYTPSPQAARGRRGRGRRGAAQVDANATPAPTPTPVPFDFTPADRLEERQADGFNQLGDIHFRLRLGAAGEWKDYSTAADRKPVTAMPAGGETLAAADLAPTLPADCPVQVTRSWKLDGGRLVLSFDLKNKGSEPIDIGALGIPVVFNNFLSNRSQEQEYEICSFFDPSIGNDAGYVQVTRLTGKGPALVVVPEGKTPLEAWYSLPGGRGVITERSPREQTQEGVFDWMVRSKAFADNEWKDAKQWNPPTEETLAPGATRTYGLKFVVSPQIRDIEKTLAAAGRPVAVGIPGYVAPMDQDVKLFLDYNHKISSIKADPAGSIQIAENAPTKDGWKAYTLHGKTFGRARLDIQWDDGTDQTISYYVIKPEAETVADLGDFLFTKQWYVDPSDPFHRSPSVMTYDRQTNKIVTQDTRVWIAGLEDEGGSGSWVAAAMKEYGDPKKAEVDKFQQFVDGVLWGGIQYDKPGDNEHPMWGVRKSMFYYGMPDYQYMPGNWTSWTSWDKAGAEAINRAYNYPHVVAAYYSMYELARYHTGLVTDHPWDWYLDHAYQTIMFLATSKNERGQPLVGYLNTGLMEGDIFVMVLQALEREGLKDKATALADAMKPRADQWDADTYPFGSEMAWDSTGQEEVYAWCTYFGYDAKATVSLNSILGYMPTVPHWGYNGNARRYWDFIYGAAPNQGIERMIHHYGSGINAIPVLAEFRKHPDDNYLLRVGYGGTMGAITNIDQDGFAATAFHSYPDKLRWDYYSGDYGPNFFGHALNTAVYVIDHPEFGWQAFGGNAKVDGDWVKVACLDSFRKRVYVATRGLWLTLDAGMFQSVDVNTKTHAVRLTLAPATQYTPNAYLRVAQPAKVAGVGTYQPAEKLTKVRDAFEIPLKSGATTIELSDAAAAAQ